MDEGNKIGINLKEGHKGATDPESASIYTPRDTRQDISGKMTDVWMATMVQGREMID